MLIDPITVHVSRHILERAIRSMDFEIQDMTNRKSAKGTDPRDIPDLEYQRDTLQDALDHARNVEEFAKTLPQMRL